MHDDAITVALDLEGFPVIKTIEHGHAVVIVVETTVPAGVCPKCSHATAESKGRRDRVLRDVPVRGKPTWIRWRRRAFRCKGCAHRFLERHELVPARVRALPRFEAYLYERSRPGMVSLSYVARIEGVSFYRVQTAHSKGCTGELDLLEEAGPIRFLSVDEAAFGRGADYNTIISAPERGRVFSWSLPSVGSDGVRPQQRGSSHSERRGRPHSAWQPSPGKEGARLSRPL